MSIAVVGVSDEEAAHLRLLMRKCAKDLDAVWRWGSEDHADLIVVDPASFAGQMTRTRAQTAGMRCAVFATAEVEGADLILRRPLQTANVIAVLNEVTGARPNAAQIAPNSADFYTRDIGEITHSADVAATDAPRPRDAQGSGEAPAQGLELRGAPPRAARPLALDPDAATMLGARAEEHAPPADGAPAAMRPAPSKNYASRAAMLADTAPRSLRAYLDEDLLGGPARIVLADAPALALDPKLKVFHAPGGLSTLEPYCRTTLRLCDWQPLTTAELGQWRVTQPAQPYSRLLWLDALVHSQGNLAAHLDPGGTYRLTRWVEIEKDLSRYFRIASAMLQPARLHEIAAASGAPMADVFDLVNAYDAIGLIEWQPRARREEKPAPGFLQRLRNPFAKS
jgi:hypothetical protein